MNEELSKTDVRYWQERLFKEVRRADGKTYQDADWSIRIAYQNRRERFQLGTANKYEAARKARQIYGHLNANGWEAALTKFKPAKAPQARRSNATVGDFLAELRLLHTSRTKTIENYAGSLRKIAADIAGIGPGGRGGNPENHRIWREKVESVKLSELTFAKAQKWKEAFLVKAGSDPVKQRSARVSVNSFLREARSLFSARILEGLDSIVLPDPLPFTGIKLEKRSMPRYQSTFDVMELVKAACDELGVQEPDQFKIFVLAVMSGLRRNEIDKLEWSSFNWHAGTISVVPTRHFRTKSDESARSVWVPAEMLAIFRGYRAKATSRFVIESEVQPITDKHYDHYRCAGLFDRLIGWLRGKGIGGGKPLHVLRKEFGSLIAAKYGIHAAKEMLGHADIATTATHYLEAKGKPTVGLGHLLPTNVVPLSDENQSVSNVN